MPGIVWTREIAIFISLDFSELHNVLHDVDLFVVLVSTLRHDSLTLVLFQTVAEAELGTHELQKESE